MIVVLSGIDKSGKSFKANELREMLTKKGMNVKSLAFPTNKSFTTKHEFLADIQKTMNLWVNSKSGYSDSKDNILLIDRYVYCTMAYQDFFKDNFAGIPRPDFGIFFNISPQHSYGKELSYEIFDMDKVFSNYQTIVKEGIFKPKHGWLKITKDTTNEYIINHILRVKSLKEGQNIIGG